MANKKSTIYVFRDWVIGKGVQFFASFPEDEVKVGWGQIVPAH